MSKHSAPSQTMIKATNLQLSRGGVAFLTMLQPALTPARLTSFLVTTEPVNLCFYGVYIS